MKVETCTRCGKKCTGGMAATRRLKVVCLDCFSEVYGDKKNGTDDREKDQGIQDQDRIDRDKDGI